jgi:hypothetical protein
VSAPGSGSLIVELGEKGTVFIDSLLGLKPSNMGDFERSNARTNDTLPQMSVVNGELWDADNLVLDTGILWLVDSGHHRWPRNPRC